MSDSKDGGIVLFLLKRKWIAVLLFAAVPLGFLFKYYSGPGHKWFNDYGAAIFYEIFWCLAVFFFAPQKKNAAGIAAGVFVITSILEILQLWHPPFLQAIRSTFTGVMLLGNTFVWWDFPHYVAGCLLGWALMRVLSTE